MSCQPERGWRGNHSRKVNIMTNKNVFGDLLSYCADNMFPESIAREKMAETARRHGNR